MQNGFGGKKLPTIDKNVTTKDYFVFIPKNLLNNSASTGNTSSVGVMVEREDWSNHETFPDDDYKTAQDVLTRLYFASAKNKKHTVISSTEETE